MKLVSHKGFEMRFEVLPSLLSSPHNCMFAPVGIYAPKGHNTDVMALDVEIPYI